MGRSLRRPRPPRRLIYAGTSAVTARGSDSSSTCSTSPRSSPSTCSGIGRSQRITSRSTSWRTRSPGRAVAPLARATSRTGQPPRGERRPARRRRGPRRTTRAAGDAHREAPGVRVRVAVGDEGERRATHALDLERLRESCRGALPRGRPPRGRTPRPRAAGRPPRGRARRSAGRARRRSRHPALNEKRRPLTRPSPIGRLDAARREARSRHRVAAEAERAGQHARPSARQEPERNGAPDPVQHLVVRAVAAEDVDRVHRGLVLAGECRRLARRRGPEHDEVGGKRRRHAVERSPR